MVDVVDKETRSRMMSGIRGKNTNPEIVIRKALHSRGFRFRLQSQTIPGRADIYLPKWESVIFVHGCFWHWHDCRFFTMPKTRTDFWLTKLTGNRLRDQRVIAKTLELGWRCIVIWECSLKGKDSQNRVAKVMDLLEKWIREGGDNFLEIDEITIKNQ